MMEGIMNTEKLLSVDEAADKMGVSPLTMRAWLRQRRLPYLKLERRVLITPQDVQQFLDSNRIEAMSFSGRD
jgi:excisionase family DNA binding protein